MAGDSCCPVRNPAAGALCSRLAAAVERVSSGAARRVSSDLAADSRQEALSHLWQHAADLRGLDRAERCDICEFRVVQHVTDSLAAEGRRAKGGVALAALCTPEGDPLDLPDEGPSLEEIVLTRLDLEQQIGDDRLRQAMARLSPERRAVIKHCMEHGVSAENAAPALGITPATARQSYTRAVRQLRCWLADAGGGRPPQEEGLIEVGGGCRTFGPDLTSV